MVCELPKTYSILCRALNSQPTPSPLSSCHTKKPAPTWEAGFLESVGDGIYSLDLFTIRKGIQVPDFWALIVGDDDIWARHPHMQDVQCVRQPPVVLLGKCG